MLGKSSRNICLGKQKWVLNLENRVETFIWECIESRGMSDDSGKIYISQYWSNLKENLEMEKKYYHQHAELGKLFLLVWM